MRTLWDVKIDEGRRLYGDSYCRCLDLESPALRGRHHDQVFRRELRSLKVLARRELKPKKVLQALPLYILVCSAKCSCGLSRPLVRTPMFPGSS